MDFLLGANSEFEDNACLVAYVGVQNQTEGEQPQVSIQFPISLRVFCIAFALSKLECKDDDEGAC